MLRFFCGRLPLSQVCHTADCHPERSPRFRYFDLVLAYGEGGATLAQYEKTWA